MQRRSHSTVFRSKTGQGSFREARALFLRKPSSIGGRKASEGHHRCAARERCLPAVWNCLRHVFYLGFAKYPKNQNSHRNFRYSGPGLAVFATNCRRGSPHRARSVTWGPLGTRQVSQVVAICGRWPATREIWPLDTLSPIKG